MISGFKSILNHDINIVNDQVVHIDRSTPGGDRCESLTGENLIYSI